MVSIKIIGPSISPFVVKTLSAAAYKNFDFDHQEHISVAELARLNRKTRKVPIAVIDDEVVIDSTRILRRFDQEKPDPPLLSADPRVAVAQRMLEDWSDESFYWIMQAFRWSGPNRDRSFKENSIYVPRPIRLFHRPILNKLVGKQPYHQGFGRLTYPELREALDERLDDLVLLLGSDDFFHGDSPSGADFGIYGVANTGMHMPDFAAAIRARPEIIAHRERVEGTISTKPNFGAYNV